MGVAGEEFGAGAERNLRFLKVVFPSVHPLSKQGAQREG